MKPSGVHFEDSFSPVATADGSTRMIIAISLYVMNLDRRSIRIYDIADEGQMLMTCALD